MVAREAAPPERAARTRLYLASERTIAGVTGKLFKHRREVTPHPYARDLAMQRELWAASMELAGLASHPKHVTAAANMYKEVLQ
ncbi:MAG: hypothetical protein U0Z44_00850 [Kouleothrix sp.]